LAFYLIWTVGAYSLLAVMYLASALINCISVLTKRIRSSVIYQSPNDAIILREGIERGTQQEYSYTKHAITNIFPVTATHDRVNGASHWNVWSQYSRNCYAAH
jgi:hypothetical protein